MKFQVSDVLVERAVALVTYPSTQTSAGSILPDGSFGPPITQDCTRCGECDGVITEHDQVTLADANAYHLMTEHGYRMDGSHDGSTPEASYAGS